MTREQLRSALRLYSITPDSFDHPVEYTTGVTIALRAGVTAVQYRDKRKATPELRRARAFATMQACHRHGALFVVNDDVQLALELGADAVHLGPHDATVAETKSRVGDRLLIGASSGTPDRGVKLVEAGADYLGVGAIFEARHSKPNASAPRGTGVLHAFRSTAGLETIPIVAIGGITPQTYAECLDAGADGVAAIRGILGQKDIESAVRAWLISAAGM